MKLEYYCPRWGCEAIPYDVFFDKVKRAGYDGVEMSLPFDAGEKKEILAGLKKAGLKLIAQHWETADRDLSLHKKNFERHLRNLAESGPVFINSQTGKDYFRFEENESLFEIAKNISSETGIRIVHETHRGKWSFASHISRTYFEKLPDLRITADFSHWCNTAESFLQDQTGAVDLAIDRADHIHTRVGFPEGPQVADPFAPEYKEALEFHLSWWDRIVERHRARKSPALTLTTEFGPAPYMPLLPYTKMPVADQWLVNTKMMELLKKRWS
ncbi:MAG: sugar phosphate isomerase/epimerase [Spirochaetia bacterium]|nr:sugar phosphate isomerase/epimerase [Spirochaetia bacterium]